MKKEQRRTNTLRAPEGGAPKLVRVMVRPEGWGLSQGSGFGSVGLGFRSECRSLGLRGFGLFGFRKIGQNTESLKLAKVGLAKVGQRAGQSWFGQSRFGQSRP